MEADRFWILLAKKMGNTASAAELEELMQFKSDPRLGQYLENELLQAAWKHPLDFSDPPDVQANWKNFREQHLQTTLPTRKFSRVYIAAGLLVALFAGYMLWPGFQDVKGKASNENIIATKNGSRSSIQLPDGTKVSLNAGSKLDYGKDFGRETRNISLSGEAFFDVAHNEKLPFIIRSGNISIKVLGTAFNLRSYPEENVTETTLLRGRIELSIDGQPNRKIELSPNEKIVVPRSSAAIASGKENIVSTTKGNDPSDTATIYTLSKISIDPVLKTTPEIAWLEDKLVFRSRELSLLSKDIERWYGVKVIISDPVLAAKKFTGSFDRLNVREALDALQYTSGFTLDFTIEKETIYLNPKKPKMKR